MPRRSVGLIKTSFQLTPEQLERLDRLAQEESATLAVIVRKVIDLGLEAYQRQQRILRAIEAPIEEAV